MPDEVMMSRNLHKKGSEVSIRSTPALLSFKGQATKHTTVKSSSHKLTELPLSQV